MQNLSRQLPPLTALVAFEAAARHENFTLAAAELGRTQSAVSRQVKELETALGLTLFLRRHKRVRLTREGRALRDAVAMGLGHIARRAGELSRLVDSNRVTVWSGASVASFWLVPRLPNFRSAHPDIEVRFSVGDMNDDWIGEQVDVYVLYGSGVWPGIEAELLFHEEMTPVCSPTYRERHTGWTPVEVAASELLHLDQTGAAWFDWQDWFDSVGYDPGARLVGPTFTSYSTAVQACLGGQGVVLGSSHILADYLATGALVTLTEHRAVPSDGYYLAVAPAAQGLPAAHALADWVRTEAGRTVDAWAATLARDD